MNKCTNCQNQYEVTEETLDTGECETCWLIRQEEDMFFDCTDEVEIDDKKEAKKVLSNVDKWFTEEPPIQEWILPGLIPMNKTGFLVAAGGTGKSRFAVQLGLAGAYGGKFLEHYDLGIKPFKTVMVAGEDDETDIHRIMYHLGKSLTEEQKEKVIDNFFIEPRAGKEDIFILTEKDDNGNAKICEKGIKRVIKYLESKKDVKLLILDTLARFNHADENIVQHAAEMIRACETISSRIGCTVLVLHHSGKSQGAVYRGSSALADNARFMLSLRSLKDDPDKEQYVVPPGLVNSCVLFSSFKNNYSASSSEDSVMLVKKDMGVLEQIDYKTTKEDKAARNREMMDFLRGNTNVCMSSLKTSLSLGALKGFETARQLTNTVNSLLERGLVESHVDGDEIVDGKPRKIFTIKKKDNDDET